jgi:myo-inositol-1(or 4)-monophosphatase
MDIDYKLIIDFMLTSGERLATRTGRIADIGITKTDLTEEDLAIERGFKEIITRFGSDHVLYAEEENDIFQNSKNLWVVDPISGTRGFIEGRPNSYSIVICHLVDRKPVFAAVYNPTANEMFTAYIGKGAFLNNKPISISHASNSVILSPSSAWKNVEVINKIKELLKNYSVESKWKSFALQYCEVACGRFDGVITATKDTFPEFAGGFIIKEAGGKFTNIQGETEINPVDGIFIGGNEKFHNELLQLIQKTALE